MDLIKKLTGKNPSEYEIVAKSLVDNSDVELFKNLVKQDDFLFDFIKENVAKRIQSACNKDNYLNLLDFLEYYSPYYDTMIAQVLYSFSGDELISEMKELLPERFLIRKTCWKQRKSSRKRRKPWRLPVVQTARRKLRKRKQHWISIWQNRRNR